MMQKKLDKLTPPEIVLGELSYTNTLEEDIRINPSNLELEFVEQANRFAYWALMSEQAKDLAARKKIQLDMLYARLDFQTRDTHHQNGSKFTEKMIEGEVTTNQDYQVTNLDLADLRKLSALLQVAKEAMVMRKDMLISLGANYRAEGQADPVMFKESARKRVETINKGLEDIKTRKQGRVINKPTNEGA
jgi:hypothetical protein